MNILKIIYAIREKLKDYTDDTRYSDDYLYFLINLKRNILVRQKYNRGQIPLDDDILSTICLELEIVNSSECPECSISTDCEIVRTIKTIPSLIELDSRSSIARIATVGIKSKPINVVSRERAIYVGEQRFERNQIYAFLHDNHHLYLKSKSPFYNSLEFITATLLVEDPLELPKYNCENGLCTHTELSRYPIKQGMIDTIINNIVEELANLKQIPEDRLNNAKADV